MRVQGWVLGARVPAALRLHPRLLQPRQWALQLQPWVPGQELQGSVSGWEVRVSVHAQVRWRQREDAGGNQGVQ